MRRRSTACLLFVLATATATGAVAGAPSSAAVPAGSNGYASFPAPGSAGEQEGEPSLAANWKTGASLLQVGLHTYKVTWDATGLPTWRDVSSRTTGLISLDPIAASDNATGRVFVSQLTAVGSLMAYSDNDGESWTTTQGSGLPAGIDHQTVGAGPYPPEFSAPLGSTYSHAVYYCSQDLVTALCARSDDGGLTYGAGVPMYSLAECGGLHGHVRVSPDGTVLVPNRNCGQGQGVIVSRDAGTTWRLSTIAGTTVGVSDPSVAGGKDGTLYVGLADGTGRALAAVSRDKGSNWSAPVDVGAAYGVRNSAFATVIAGDGDRAAMAFLGTKTPGNSQDPYFGMDPTHTRYLGATWHLYIATTYDRGRTWSTVDATPKDPVQRGRICLGGTGCSGMDRNLLDFMDIQADRSGRVLVGWPDGCIGTCVDSDTVASNTYSSKGTITRQTSGKGLFATPPKLAD